MPSTDSGGYGVPKGAKLMIKKHEGDDAYSWAVCYMQTAKPVSPELTGLNKMQASHYKRMVEAGREPSKNSEPKGGKNKSKPSESD